MNHVLDHYSVDQAAFSEGLYSTTCSQLKDFLYELKRRWGWSNRTVNVFLQKNKSWLDRDVIFMLRGYCTSYQKSACFVLYLKIINNFLKNKSCILQNMIKELKNGIEILVGRAVFKL